MELWQVITAGLVAVAGGLGTGLAIGAWLSRRELRRIFDVVDRMPAAEWFQRVESKIDRLDPERISSHFDRLDAHHETLTRHDGAITELRRDVDDHEKRLRVVERPT